jgi:3-oxoadipate enol-lactonase
MPMIRANGTAIYYEDTGGSGTPIVFSHGLLWSTRLFAPQVGELKKRYRCIAYDHRGQGRSADDDADAISVVTFTDDAAALIDALNLGPVHFCGLSLGGIVGMRLALSRPSLIRSLVLLDTTAEGEPSKLKYKVLNLVVRLFGVKAAVATAIMPALHGKTALADPARAGDRHDWQDMLMANRNSIWRAVNGVLARKSMIADLGEISAPTLVAVGEEDVGTPLPMSERIAQAIPGAKLLVIPRAGHCSTLEEPEAVTSAIAGFVNSVEAAPLVIKVGAPRISAA